MIIIIILILCIVYNIHFKEHFELIDNKTLKEDNYMIFLSNIKEKLNVNKINKDTQSKAIDYAFSLQTVSNDVGILNSGDPVIYNTKKDECINKANKLCERTDPKFYLQDAKYFPPRWIGPYKNVDLPKHTDLNCFNKIYDCCI